jgi:surface protein
LDYKSIKDCKLSHKIEYYLSVDFYYYWNFKTTGIHTIKIIFKKKLSQCNGLFCGCGNIYKIDCSHFDCSQIIDCSQMFSYCSSVVEINLGKLDFALSSSFFGMFRYCPNLEKLDVSNLNTQNAKGFKEMFLGCKKLKEINVSNFKTKNCKNISQMFEDCKSLESIDMIKWDMSNIQDDGIANLFYDCSSLKSIKMNFNNQYYFLEKKREDSEEIKEKKETKEKNDLICFKENLEGELMREETPSNDDIFRGLPKKGIFIWRKGTNCKELLKLMPPLWNKMTE